MHETFRKKRLAMSINMWLTLSTRFKHEDWSAKTRDEGYFVTVLKNGLSAAKKQNIDHTRHYLRTVVKLYNKIKA
jgi:hypothetical protein